MMIIVVRKRGIMTKKIENQRSLLFLFVLPIFMLIIILGGTYALSKVIIKGEEKVFLEVGEFKVHFVDSDVVNLNNATPLPDEVGMSLPSYSFTVQNTGTLDANYQLSLEQSEVTQDTLNQNYIRYSVKINDEEWSTPTLLSELNNLMITSFSSLAPESEHHYEIKLWLDEHANNEAQGKVFEARLVLDAVQDSFILPDTTPPEIRLNGETVMNIKQHTPFVDPGISSVTDDRDKLEIDEIETAYYFLHQEELIEVDSIDTTVIGVYYIHYSISDTSGNKGIVVRTVNIYLPDTTPPEISLIGDEIIRLEQYDDYIEPGIKAIDNIDGDITHRVVTIGTVNTTLVGSYPIKYIITDQAGNTASVSRVVNVVEVIYVLPARFGQTVEMHNFWNEIRILNPREIIFQRGVGPSESLREEFERNNSQFLFDQIIDEQEYEELWETFLSQRFRRVKAPLSEGYVETYLVIDEENVPRQYIQSKSGKLHTPVNSTQLFGYYWQLETLDNIKLLNTNMTTNMSNMFSDAPRITELNLHSFDTSNVTNMSYMFAGASGLTELDLSSFDTSNVTSMQRMFYGITNLAELDLSSFDTFNVTNMMYMFGYSRGFIKIDLSTFTTSNVRNMSYMFAGASGLTELDLSSFDTSNVTNMSYMFAGASGLTELDLSSIDTSNVTNMMYMFANASGLTELDLRSFDTSSVINMRYMFSYASGLTELNLRSFDTSNVTSMVRMFADASGLTELDLRSFDTSNVTEMGSIFSGASGLTELDLSSFDTSNVTNMSYMFADASKLTGVDLRSFDTSNVTSMGFMFSGASGLTELDLRSFDTSNAITMINMFRNTRNLNEVLVTRDTWKTMDVNTSGMFSGSKINSVTFG